MLLETSFQKKKKHKENFNVKVSPICLKFLHVYLIACLLPSRYLFTSLLLHQLQEKKKPLN